MSGATSVVHSEGLRFLHHEEVEADPNAPIRLHTGPGPPGSAVPVGL